METPIVYELLAVFGLSIAVLLVCHRFKVPQVVGYLVTGVLVGPSGLNLIPTNDVETLASLGVVLLLFGVGVEFSVRELFSARRDALLGGGLQLLLTAAVLALGAWLFHIEARAGLFVGFVLALSSTTLILRELAAKGEVTSPHGRSIVAILIFQDIASIPLMLCLPFFAGKNVSLGLGAGWVSIKALAVLLGTLVLGRWVVPALMERVARTKSQELFHITAITLCLAIPALLSKAGLSVALGAFLTGLILSDSDYAHSTLGSLLPIRDIFASLFFISIGMLLNLQALTAGGTFVVFAALGVLALKAALGTLVGLALSKPLRTAILIGTAISPAGEFGLLLIQAGSGLGILGPDTYQLLLGITILTMALTPASFLFGRWLAYNKGALASYGQSTLPEPASVVIVGFGIVGRGVAHAARYAKIPYRVIELNPLTVRKERRLGVPILYGDATNPEMLRHAGVLSADVLVITVHADPLATRNIVKTARQLNPSLTILARVPFMTEAKTLKSLGANDVVTEELETAIALFGRVLIHIGLKEKEVLSLTETLRQGDYDIVRPA
jgi:CPA2 family monovalent cation:H+ antiporter-2